MISHFFNIEFGKVEDLTITQYKVLLEQAQNIASLYRGGKFEFIDTDSRREEFLEQIQFFKSQGRLN